MKTDKLSELNNIIETLLSENGCPWDKKQTLDTLKPFIIEESYEVLDAINRKKDDDIKEELGDVLFLLAFCSKIKEKEGIFNFDDVIENVKNKMIFRHPNVFKEYKAVSEDEVLKSWDELKKEEKGISSDLEILKSIPNSLPALLRTEKVIKKAKKIKKEEANIKEILSKIKVQIDDIEQEFLNTNSMNSGDFIEILFNFITISSYLNINSEFSLTNRLETFINKFEC